MSEELEREITAQAAEYENKLNEQRHYTSEAVKRIEELENAVRWVSTGDVGASSKAIFRRMTGNGVSHYYPCDPGDFCRCLLLLEAVPEWAVRLGEMRKISPEWERLVDHWDEIAEMFKSEATNYQNPNMYWNAPKTFDLMQTIIKGEHRD